MNAIATNVGLSATVNMKHILAALHCASTEETRYYLNGVCVQIRARETFAVATDGHVLFAAHHALKADETFKGVLKPGEPDNKLIGDFILTSTSVKAIKPRRIVDANAVMTLVDKTTVKLVCDDEDFYAKLIDGTFPDWRRAVPSDTNLAKAKEHIDDMDYNSRKLEAFWKCAKVLDSTTGGSGNPFYLARNGSGPALVRFADPDAIGCIMPYRTSAKRGKRPAWI